jgi:hypothetical protein
MAGIRVTAVAYSSLVDIQPVPFPDPLPLWYFIVLVTDSNAKPIAKLKLGNFSVKVHAKGVQGPVISPNLTDIIDEKVTLDWVSEAPSTSGVYMLRAQSPQTNESGTSYKFSDRSYVFSVSVVSGRSTSRALIAYGPGQVKDDFTGTSV